MSSEPEALQAVFEDKAATYREFGNGVALEEARRLLPGGGRVLDLGCASGGLLALLRDQASHTAGLELSPTAAAQAAEVADQVVTGGIDDPDLPFEQGGYDLVVLADVVEHLVDPEGAVRRAASWAAPGGWVLVSVPNIAHWQARLVVLRGQWRAEDSGTWDATHLRFFTEQRLRDLLAGAGLTDIGLRPVVPRLRNVLPAVERLPGGERAERGWQALGRRRPNLLGYQLVAWGRRP